MATQIALLINKYNLWSIKYTTNMIYNSPASYFVEIVNSRVVGCASLLEICPALSKIQHICVVPEFRCKGIATKLTKLAIELCNTDYLYMTIREDNGPSLGLARILEFKYIKNHWFKNHYTVTVGRRKMV
jgi:ribosomal protein S18 acetylase RimI-like enzyme